MTTFTFTELKPHFEKQIAQIAEDLADWQTKFERDAYDALDWSDEVFKLAARQRLIKQVRHLCECLADQNDGNVDRETVVAELDRKLADEASSCSMSSSPARNIMSRTMIAALAAAKRDGHSSQSPLRAFASVEWERERVAHQAKMEKADWLVRRKSGGAPRWRQADGRWTSSISKAQTYSYEARNKMTLNRDEQWEMIEA